MNVWRSVLSQEVAQQMGWTLVHSVWQGAVGAVLLGMLLWMMKRASAQARYVASCAALLAVVVAGGATLRHESTSIVTRAPAAPVPIVPPAMYDRLVDEDPLTLLAPASAPLEKRWRAESFLPWAVLLWAVGVFVIALWQLGGWARARHWTRQTAGLASKWEPMLRELKDRMGISAVVRLVEAKTLRTPAVVGAIRPVILVPVCIMSGLTETQVEAILAHELAHIRRHDYLVNLLQTVVETLLFYHPAVWWISSRIRQERENCCDDIAAQVCGDRTEYAEALAAIGEMRLGSLALGAGGGSLKVRVARILGVPVESQRTRWSMWAGVAAVVCVVMAFGTVKLSAQKAEEKKEPSAKGLLSVIGNASDSPPEARIEPGDLEVDKAQREYRIGANDLLSVSINGLTGNNVETVKTARVTEAGNANMPLIGEVKVAGLTVPEAERAIAMAYKSANLMANPVLSVTVAEARGRTFSILGKVKNPGQYQLTQADFRALDALALAGGLTDGAGDLVVIRKAAGDQQKARKITVPERKLMRGDQDVNVVIRPGDMILVGDARDDVELPMAMPLNFGKETGEYYMGGDIARVGVYSLTGRKINLKMALISAGLWEDDGEPRLLTLIRREKDSKETWVLKNEPIDLRLENPKLSLVLRPDDIVNVMRPLSKAQLEEQKKLEAQLADLQRGLAEERAMHTDNNPQIVQLKAKIDAVRSQMDQLKKSSTTSPTK